MTALHRPNVSFVDALLVLLIVALAAFSGGIVGAILGVIFGTFLVTTIDRLDSMDERIGHLAEENARLRERIDDPDDGPD